MSRWETIANALRAYQQAQQSTWGELDDHKLARYIEGNASPDERREIDRAMGQFPALAELKDVVSEALGLSEGNAAEPAGCWQAVQGGMQLIDRLVAWVDRTGQTMAAGLQRMFVPPPLAVGQAMDQGEVREAKWEIPLPGLDPKLRIAIRPERGSSNWVLRLEVAGGNLADNARLELRNAEGRRIVAGRLTEYLSESIMLAPGATQMMLKLTDRTLLIPIQAGHSPR